MALGNGKPIALSAAKPNEFTATLRVTDDNSYRVALADHDGFASPGDTEYFIRTLEDRPPDVRVLKPATDRSVTRLEEVDVEAQAEDDFGIDRLDLVYSVRGEAEKVVPLSIEKQSAMVNGRHTLFLEDLKVQPGDFVSYYVRARDLTRGTRPNEARSDIFFLEVKPYEQEFSLAQSQGGMPGGSQGIDRRPGHGAERDRRRDLEARSARPERQRRQVGRGHQVGRQGGERAEDARRADREHVPRIEHARSAPAPAAARPRTAAAAADHARAQGRRDAARGRQHGRGRHRDGQGRRLARRAEDVRRAAAGDGSAQPPAQGAGRREEARGDAAAGGQRQRQQPQQLRHVVAVRQGAAEDSSRPTTKTRGRPPSRRKTPIRARSTRSRISRAARTSC